MAGWSYSTGERGRNRVRAYEQARDGRLRLEWREAGIHQSCCNYRQSFRDSMLLRYQAQECV